MEPFTLALPHLFRWLPREEAGPALTGSRCFLLGLSSLKKVVRFLPSLLSTDVLEDPCRLVSIAS